MPLFARLPVGLSPILPADKASIRLLGGHDARGRVGGRAYLSPGNPLRLEEEEEGLRDSAVARQRGVLDSHLQSTSGERPSIYQLKPLWVMSLSLRVLPPLPRGARAGLAGPPPSRVWGG